MKEGEEREEEKWEEKRRSKREKGGMGGEESNQPNTKITIMSVNKFVSILYSKKIVGLFSGASRFFKGVTIPPKIFEMQKKGKRSYHIFSGDLRVK